MSVFYNTPASGPLQPVTGEVPRYQSCNLPHDPTSLARLASAIESTGRGLLALCLVGLIVFYFSEWYSGRALSPRELIARASAQPTPVFSPSSGPESAVVTPPAPARPASDDTTVFMTPPSPDPVDLLRMKLMGKPVNVSPTYFQRRTLLFRPLWAMATCVPPTRPTPSRKPTPSFLEDGCSPALATSMGSTSPSTPPPLAPVCRSGAFYSGPAARPASRSVFGSSPPTISSIELESINAQAPPSTPFSTSAPGPARGASSRLVQVPTPDRSRTRTMEPVHVAPSAEEQQETFGPAAHVAPSAEEQQETFGPAAHVAPSAEEQQETSGPAAHVAPSAEEQHETSGTAANPGASSRLAPVSAPVRSRTPSAASAAGAGEVAGGAPSMEEPQTPPPQQPGRPGDYLELDPWLNTETPSPYGYPSDCTLAKAPSYVQWQMDRERVVVKPAKVPYVFVPPVPQSLVASAEQAAFDALVGLSGITEMNETMPMIPAAVFAPRFVFVALEAVDCLTTEAKNVRPGVIDLGAMMSVRDIINQLGDGFTVALETYHTVGPYSCDRWINAIGDFAFASRQAIEHLDVLANSTREKLWFRSREYAKTVLDAVSHAVHEFLVENEFPSIPNRLAAEGNDNAAFVASLLSRNLPKEVPSPPRARPKTQSEASYDADVSADTTASDAPPFDPYRPQTPPDSTPSSTTLSGTSSQRRIARLCHMSLSGGSQAPRSRSDGSIVASSDLSGSFPSISAGSIHSAREMPIAQVPHPARSSADVSAPQPGSQQAAPSASTNFSDSFASISAGSIHSAREICVAPFPRPARFSAGPSAQPQGSEAAGPSASTLSLSFSAISATDIRRMVQQHMGRTSSGPSTGPSIGPSTRPASSHAEHPQPSSVSGPSSSSSGSLHRARQMLRTARPSRPSARVGFREELSSPATTQEEHPQPSSASGPSSASSGSLHRARQMLRTARPARPSGRTGFREELSSPAPSPAAPSSPVSYREVLQVLQKVRHELASSEPPEITESVLIARRRHDEKVARAAAAAPWLPGFGPSEEPDLPAPVSSERVQRWVRSTRERQPDTPPSQHTLESVWEDSSDSVSQSASGCSIRGAGIAPETQPAGPSTRPSRVATNDVFRWTFLPEDKQESSFEGDSFHSWRSNAIDLSDGAGSSGFLSAPVHVGNQTLDRLLNDALADWEPRLGDSSVPSGESFSAESLGRFRHPSNR